MYKRQQPLLVIVLTQVGRYVYWVVLQSRDDADVCMVEHMPSTFVQRERSEAPMFSVVMRGVGRGCSRCA